MQTYIVQKRENSTVFSEKKKKDFIAYVNQQISFTKKKKKVRIKISHFKGTYETFYSNDQGSENNEQYSTRTSI